MKGQGLRLDKRLRARRKVSGSGMLKELALAERNQLRDGKPCARGEILFAFWNFSCAEQGEHADETDENLVLKE